MSQKREVILRVRRCDDGRLEVEDWRGAPVKMLPHEIGAHVDRVLASPDLPPVDVVAPGVGRIAEIVAQRVAPGDRDIVGPGLVGAWQLIQVLRRFAADGRRPEPPAPAPSPGPPRDEPYRRPSFRRGQRVT